MTANKDGLTNLVKKLNKAQCIVAKYYKIIGLQYIMSINYDDIKLQLLTIHREDLLKAKNIDYSKMNLSKINKTVCHEYPFYSPFLYIKDALIFRSIIKIEWLLNINRLIPIMKGESTKF